MIPKSNIRIKYADWPFILYIFLIFLVLVAAGSFFFSSAGYTIYIIVLSLFLLIITHFHIYRLQQEEMINLQYNVQAIQELNNLLPLRTSLPPMIGWAATPGLAINIHKLIHQHRPKHIVELGSGISTLIAAYSLEMYHPEGKIISIDHDPDFAKETDHELKIHQLSKFVEIRVAALKECEIDNKPWKWYDTEKVHFDFPIDLLIIDGPPLKTQKNARYPALPLLYRYLSTDAVVIMHDAYRKQESDILQKWEQNFLDFTFSIDQREKGIAILKRNS